MTIKVTRLTANNIRGIRHLQLPLETNILVLGENGCGKSSIIDAIEYYFTGRVEKLSGRQDIRENLSLQYAGGGPLSVAFQFSKDPNDYPVSFPYIKPEVPDSLKGFFKSAAERPFILRRSQLLGFIEARPADRYDFVSKLIGLGDLDTIEALWREKANEANRNLKAVKQELLGTTTQLTQLLGTKIQTEKQIIQGINQKLTENGIEPVSQHSDLINRKEVIHGKSANPENIRKAEQFRQLKRKIDDLLVRLKAIIPVYDRLFDAWQSFLANAETADEAIFEKLLLEVFQIINENPIEICPICEEPITDREKLICRLNERTNALRAFTESRKTLELCESAFSQILDEFSRLIKELVAELSQMAFGEIANLLENQIVVKFNPWRQHLVRKPLTLIPPDEFQRVPIIQEAKSILDDALDATQKQITSLTPSDEESRISQLVDLLGQVDALWQLWIRVSEHKEIAEKTQVQIKTIYDELIAAKKRGLDQILAQLDSNFVELYGKIHPEEGYKRISLILPINRDSSIGLEAQKEGSAAMHPLGIFSEGHLDSLGLCIFLAFIKRFNEDFKLIVLDDILTSIDAGHRMRVAQLLAREFNDYQIILTTHDEMWANEILGIFKAKGLPLKSIHLNPWEKEIGTTYDEYVNTDWDYYRELAKHGHQQDAIAGIGRALEKFLLTVRRHLHLAVPATMDDRYTLGDLFPVFFAWIDKHKFVRPDIPDLWQYYPVLKEEFDAYWRLRNWSGAHYNDWGATVSKAEAIAFIQIVEDIVHIFTCPVCKTLVIYNPELRLLHCPQCEATPPIKVVWEYDPKWMLKVERLLLPECNVKDKKQHSIRASSSSYERFLRDARRKLRLPIIATPDDQYGLIQLHPAYIQFLTTHHRPEIGEWHDTIQRFDATFLEFTADGNGLSVIELESQAEKVFDTLKGLIDLSICQDCQGILSFDSAKQTYFCSQCQTEEKTISLAANWSIV